MSHYHGDDAEYDMEDVDDDDMDEEFHGREMAGSESDVEGHDHAVCDNFFFVLMRVI